MRRDVAQDGLLGAGETGNEYVTRVGGGIASGAVFKYGADGIEGKRACDLAADVAAHAVGDGDEAPFALELFVRGGLEVTIIVLVFRAYIAGVGEVSEIDVGSYFHVLREP